MAAEADRSRDPRTRELVYAARLALPARMAHAVQILQTAAALARQGAHVTVLPQVAPEVDVPSAVKDVLGGAAPAGLDLLPVRGRHKGWIGLRWRLAFRSAVRRAARRAGGSCVILARDRRHALPFAARRAGSRTRLIYELHNLEHVLAAERGDVASAARIRAEEERLVRGADGIVAISAGLAEDVRAAFDLDSPPPVIPDGVDLDRLGGRPPAQHALADAARRVLIVYAGSLYSHKGVDALVEALAYLPARFELRLVGGGDRADEERIDAAIASLEAEGFGPGRARRVGRVPAAEVAAELHRADLIAIPAGEGARAQRYTSPLKLFEAMASGVPIVAAPTPALRSILVDGETGFFAASAAPRDWAAACDRAASDPAAARAVAQRAAIEARRYTWDERARRLLELASTLD